MRDFIIQKIEKNLLWWYNRRKNVDWDPPFQRRGKLWSDSDKAYLVDSIINGYDIPKIYMADFNLGESKINYKKLPYAIIDGKQRFEAIFDFFDNNIVLNEDFVLLEDPSLKLGGLSFKDLKANYKDIAEEFENAQLTIIGVFSIKEEYINELFVRLNRSKPLTGAEIRNAMTGPVPQLIREIAKHDFFKNYVSFSTSRGEDLNTAAKILLFEYSETFKDTKKFNLDHFVVVSKTKPKASKLELSARQVIDFLDDMTNIFLPKDRLLISSGVIPVYYWFIRGIKSNQSILVRKFLVEFEQKRRENRSLLREDQNDPNINFIFVEYDNYNRSTNNEQSHRERYEIIRLCFEYWIKKGTFPKKRLHKSKK